MKSLLLALLMVSPLALRAQNPELYKLSYTVTGKDGTKNEGKAAFLADDPVSLPIMLENVGLCVLEFSPEGTVKPLASGIFSIKRVSDGAGAEMKQIFYTFVPVELGSERQLVKVFNQTVTIQIAKAEGGGKADSAKTESEKVPEKKP